MDQEIAAQDYASLKLKYGALGGAEPRKVEIDVKKMHENSLFEARLSPKNIRQNTTPQLLPQTIAKSQDSTIKKLPMEPLRTSSERTLSKDASGNPYSILKSSALWKKKPNAEEHQQIIGVQINI